MLAKSFLWISSVGLPLVILTGSIDFGGILPWSRWMAAVASLALAIIACAGFALTRHDRQRSFGQSQFDEDTSTATMSALLPAACLLIAALYIGIQAVELPSEVVRFLSPGSADAFLNWGSFPGEPDRTHIPVSVNVDATLHAMATLLAISVFAVTAAFSLTGRTTIAQFFIWMAIGGAMAAAFGLYRLSTGDPYVFDARVPGFGVFVNRNAAALWMNLGLASSLGLIAFRAMERFGTEVDDPNFEVNDWTGLLSDPIAIVGIISGLLSLVGILACGSRGGIVALVVGLMTALGWIRGGRGWKTIPLVAFVILIGSVILVVPFRLSMRSLKRFSLFGETGTGTLSEDGRIQHWQDGISAALAYFPMGSGAGGYADAYRPFQEKSSQATFAHADNLWLEWSVELGFFGIAVIILVAIFMIVQLSRLSESDEAIDQGVRVAGWYTLASVGVAESFNFGLLYLCNGLFFVSIATIVAYRARLTGNDAVVDLNPVQLTSPVVDTGMGNHRVRRFGSPSQWMAILIPATAMVGCFVTVTRLGEDAAVDSAIRAREVSGSTTRLSVGELEQWIERLEKLPHNSDVESELSLVYFTHGRRLDLRDLDPNTDAEAVELFRQTQTTLRRLRWDQSGKVDGPRPLSPDAKAAYDQSIESARHALMRRPLAIEPRTRLIAADFHHQNVLLAEKMYDDLAMLVQTNAGELYKLGRYAAGSKDKDRTFQTWNRAMKLSPPITTRVLPELFARKLDWREWQIPDDPAVSLVATKWLLDQTDPNPQLLQMTTANLDRESTESQADFVDRLRTSAEAKLVLGRYEDAFDDYRAAAKANPVNADLRFQLANRLLAYGFRDEARSELMRARDAIPDDPRFDALLKKCLESNSVPQDTSVDHPKNANENANSVLADQ